MRKVLSLTPACFVVVVACGKSTESVAADQNGVDARYSFSPQAAARTCVTNTDCVILPALSNCGSCCGSGAVSKGEPERAYAEAARACSQPGAPDSVTCSMACGELSAACFEGTCVSVNVPSSWNQMPDSGACTPSTADADAGAPAELGAGPACGAAAVQTGFDALDPSWTLTGSDAISIDTSAPISGPASLRVSYRQESAFVSIPQPEACGVRIAFTVRTKLLAKGISLGRVVAGEGTWFHLQLSECSLSIMEEMRNSQAAGMGGSGVSWPVPDDTPVRVVLTFDLNGKTMTSTAAPLGQPLPAPKSTPLRGDPTGEVSPTGIRAIELGATQGFANGGYGTVWFDDLSID